MVDAIKIVGAILIIVLLLESFYLFRYLSPSAIRERMFLKRRGLDENGYLKKENLSMKVKDGKIHYKKN